MARKLRTFQTSLGFYDLAIAAPSMKAALEAWGSNLFHQGVAKETDDPDVVAATFPSRQDRTDSSLSIPTFGPTSNPTGLGGQGVGRSQRHERLLRSASGRPEKRPPISRRSRSAAQPSAGAKRPPEKGIANGGKKRRRKPKRRWTRPSASMRRGPRPSRPRRSAHGLRTTAGTRKENSCKPRCGVRATEREDGFSHRDLLRKKILSGLETFWPLPNFFGVAMAAAGTPFGVPWKETGAGRCPEPARTHLAPRRIWI